MEQREVSAKAPKLGTEASIVVNYAETIEEAVEMFGADAVLSNAFANWRVTLQGNIRAKLAQGMSPEQIQDTMKDAKMGVAVTGGKVDPEQAFIAKFRSATPEDQAKMLEQLKAAASA